MTYKVLLASRDSGLLTSRSLLLRYAGHESICASTLNTASSLATKAKPHLIILDHTFSSQEQSQFIADWERQRGQGTAVLCLDHCITPPKMFLDTCATQLAMLDEGEVAGVDEIAFPSERNARPRDGLQREIENSSAEEQRRRLYYRTWGSLALGPEQMPMRVKRH